MMSESSADMEQNKLRGGKFRVIANDLKELLESGQYEVGDRFFSENLLCRKYGVSRQTVRKALSLLEDEGMIERIRGSGTYVKQVHVVNEKKRSMNIAVIVTYLSDYIFPVILKEMEKVSPEGYFGSLFSLGNSVTREREF